MSVEKADLEVPLEQGTKGQDGGPKSKSCYYYVVIVPEDQAVSQDSSRPVSTMSELMGIMSRNKRSRFVSASSPEEAEKKAKDLERIQCHKEAESIMEGSNGNGDDSLRSKRKGRQSFSAVEESIGKPATETPKTHDLLLMGREIMGKRNEAVFERIAKNARILCTDMESPTTLQEGCKYNALHLAARYNNFEVMKKVLDLISCIDFLREIYPKQTDERLRSSCKHLVSTYLNSPDKMMYQTPIHFACAYNHIESVKLLLTHPFCDTTLKNWENRTAFEVIGDRDKRTGSKADAVRRLFSDMYIVPIWRDLSIDGEAPVMGEVSFIHDLGQEVPHPLLQEEFPNFSTSLLKPCKTELNPPTRNKLPESSWMVFAQRPSNWKIRAFAGPMSEENAKEFRKMMKRSRGLLFGISSPESSLNLSIGVNRSRDVVTPPIFSFEMSPTKRAPNTVLSPNRSGRESVSFVSPFRSFRQSKSGVDVRVRDVEKGLERISMEHCKELGVPWSEYWQCLGTFCDLSNETGVDILETHFASLEALKQHEEISELITSSNSDTSFNLDEIIDKFHQMKLNSSGIASPLKDSEGFCTNPRCRMNARFCNCADVVPSIRYDTSETFSWLCAEIEDRAKVQEVNTEWRTLRRMEMRERHDISSSDYSESDENAVSLFDWGGDVEDVFATAPTSPMSARSSINSPFEECKATCVYLSGEDKPGKYDHQVFMLLKDYEDLIDSVKHLHVFQWLNSMRSNVHTLGRRGPIPITTTPKRDWEPSFVSTPVKPRGLDHLLFDEEEEEEEAESDISY